MWPLTDAEQLFLLRLARQIVDAAARGEDLPLSPAPLTVLEEPRGAFVTLRKSGELRGCIGHILAFKSLYETVRESAFAAALNDPRFDPVRPEELPYILIEISILSPLADVAPEQIEVGRHGILISQGDQRGVLLPQVAVEMNWDRNRFLEETCHKAGLPRDAWLKGARIQAFTTHVFAEPRELAADD